MIVKVKPIKRTMWSRWQRYPKCHDTIAPYLDASGKGVVTGLTKDQEREFEDKLHMTPGELSQYSSFWTDYKIIITEKGLELDTNNAHDELKYAFIQNHKRVRNSINEVAEWPYADYVIYDQEADAKKENVKVRSVRKAYAKFGQMSTEDMRDVLKLYGKKSEILSTDMVENMLDKLITEDPDAFLDIVTDKNIKTKVMIEDCLRSKILRKNGSHIIWGDEPIGHDIETAVLFLNDLANQSIKINILSKLEAVKKAK